MHQDNIGKMEREHKGHWNLTFLHEEREKEKRRGRKPGSVAIQETYKKGGAARVDNQRTIRWGAQGFCKKT